MQRYYVIQGAHSIVKTKTLKHDGRALLTHKQANFMSDKLPVRTKRSATWI
jgi:hypothetical protein